MEVEYKKVSMLVLKSYVLVNDILTQFSHKLVGSQVELRAGNGLTFTHENNQHLQLNQQGMVTLRATNGVNYQITILTKMSMSDVITALT